ncbi:MAG: hypothetical protein Ct9H90mP11_04220 [Acidimicrobiales bacterium]|nr:MAG: hypothetical protein Ct9H90mP11_04220 [Acidimicrobiales bacterium]
MPLANCEVGGGIAPIPELLDAGVTVGLWQRRLYQRLL